MVHSTNRQSSKPLCKSGGKTSCTNTKWNAGLDMKRTKKVAESARINKNCHLFVPAG